MAFAPPSDLLIAARVGKRGANPYWDGYEGSRSSVRQRYALDPFALADDNLAIILDLETIEEIPLKLWEHQREVISAWVDLDWLAETMHPRFSNVHEEKSRQMGLTWVTAYVVCWALNFHNLAGLALSQKLGEINDSGPTTDSFFGKVKFIWEHLPDHLRTPLIFVGGNDPSIRNPAMQNSFLAGEGATPDAGRGGRYDYVFLDEASRIPWGRVVHTAVSRACPRGRFYNSTPNGEDPLYFWLRDKRPRGYQFLRHHWSRNPVYARGIHVAALSPEPDMDEPGGPAVQPTTEMKAAADACPACQATMTGVLWDATNPVSHRFPGRLCSPWYDAAVTDLTNEQVAQELDIDYAGSLPARVFTEFSEERNVIDHIPWDPDLPIELSFDYGWSMTAVGIFQETPNEYRMIGEFEQPDLLPEQVAAGIRQALRNLGVPADRLMPHNTLTWLARGDVAGESHQMATGRPLVADYRRAGFHITSRMFQVDQTVIAVKRLLMGKPKLLLFSADTCPQAIRHIKNHTWEVDRIGVRKPKAHLKNDVHGHAMRALAYLVTHKFPPPEKEAPEEFYRRGEETGRVDPGVTYDMVG